MGEPKPKPTRRVAGASKFRLPERSPRLTEVNPLRELLQEARAQQEESDETASATVDTVHHEINSRTTPAKINAGVQPPRLINTPSQNLISTPAKINAGVDEKLNSISDLERPDSYGINSFSDFSKRWAPILRSGQMSICRVLYERTHGIDEKECFTSMPKLAQAAGLKERQCYNVISQLEQLGFIERPDIFNTPTKKGTVFRLFLFPRHTPSTGGRLYHIGGDD